MADAPSISAPYENTNGLGKGQSDPHETSKRRRLVPPTPEPPPVAQRAGKLIAHTHQGFKSTEFSTIRQMTGAAECFLNLGFFDDVLPLWEQILEKVRLNATSELRVPPGFLAYLCAATAAPASSRRRMLIPNACDDCFRQTLAAKYPTPFHEIQLFLDLMAINKQPSDFWIPLYGLQALACGWVLPEQDVVQIRCHLKQVMDESCEHQDGSFEDNRIRSCLLWCHHQLCNLDRGSQNDRFLENISCCPDVHEAIWISSVHLYCFLWEKLQMESEELAWLCTRELMGLSVEKVLQLLCSLIIEMIPVNFFELSRRATPNWREGLTSEVLNGTDRLINLDFDQFVSRLVDKATSPKPFRCCPVRTESKEFIRHQVGDVIRRCYPAVASDMEPEQVMPWAVVFSTPPSGATFDPPLAPSITSSDQTFAAFRKLRDRIKDQGNLPSVFRAPSMDAANQLSETMSRLSLSPMLCQPSENSIHIWEQGIMELRL